MNRPRHILILLLGAIGDVTRALPLAARIKSHQPDAKLLWAVEPKSLSVVDQHELVDKVVVFERNRGIPAYIDFVRALRKAEVDIVLDLQRHLKSGVTSWLTGAKRRIGFNRKNAKEFNWLFNTEYIPEVENFSSKLEHYQLFGDALELPRPEVLDFGIRPRNEMRASLETLLEQALVAKERPERISGYAGLILGSSWPSRFWQAEYYQQLATNLWATKNLLPVFLGGEGERLFEQEIVGALSAMPYVSLVGKTSLQDLFQLFGLMRVAIGPDSGPMHIAATAGIPVVSFWGATSPLRSAPYGSEQLVIQSPIGCAPCYRRECPGLDRLCMKQITPKTVLAFVDQALEGSANETPAL